MTQFKNTSSSRFIHTAFVGSLLFSGLAVIAQTTSTITSSFNSTAVGGDNWLWINARMTSINFNGASASAPVVRVYVTGASLSFSDTAAGQSYSIPLPNEVLTFSSGILTSSVAFGASKWNADFPKPGSTTSANSPFLTGMAYQLSPAGISGGISPVSMTALFSTDQAGVSFNWNWSVAAYSQMSSDPNSLGVTAADGLGMQSGTPRNVTQYLIAGGRSGGVPNYTGTTTSTLSVTPAVVAGDPTVVPVPEPSTWGAAGMVGILAALSYLRRRRAA